MEVTEWSGWRPSMAFGIIMMNIYILINCWNSGDVCLPLVSNEFEFLSLVSKNPRLRRTWSNAWSRFQVLAPGLWANPCESLSDLNDTKIELRFTLRQSINQNFWFQIKLRWIYLKRDKIFVKGDRSRDARHLNAAKVIQTDPNWNRLCNRLVLHEGNGKTCPKRIHEHSSVKRAFHEQCVPQC